MKIKRHSGERFGSLTLIKPAGQEPRPRNKWLCKCDCGTIVKRLTTTLMSGRKLQSCGCLRSEACKVRESVKNWRELAIVLNYYKRNAITRGLAFDLTAIEFDKIASSPCYYCNTPPVPRTYKSTKRGKTVLKTITYSGVDRLENGLGYSLDNCVPCCKKCNIGKNSMASTEWISHCKLVASRNA